MNIKYYSTSRRTNRSAAKVLSFFIAFRCGVEGYGEISLSVTFVLEMHEFIIQIETATSVCGETWSGKWHRN